MTIKASLVLSLTLTIAASSGVAVGASDQSTSSGIPKPPEHQPLIRKGTKPEPVDAGKPISIGKVKRVQLPDEPEFYFIDKQGKRAVPYMIYEANEFHEGLAAILIADQWGYIDKTGDVVIGADFDLAGDFNDGLAPVKVKDKWGYIDHSGKFVIEPRFVGAETFKNGLAAVQLGKDSPEFPQKATDALQTILKDTEMPAMKKAWLAIASSRASGIIDTNGKFLFEPFYSSIQNFSDDLCLAKDSGTVVFLNKKGDVVFRPECQDAKPFSEGLAAIKVKDKWGFVNSSGVVVVKPIFDDVEDFQKGLCAASIGKKWGFINKKGKWDIKPKYDVVWEGFKTGVAVVGKDMCPIANTHADVTRVGGGFLVARRNGNGQDFDESTTPLEPGYFAYPDYRFTIIDKEEKPTIDKQFDHVGLLNDGVRVIRLDGKFGFADNNGKTFIEPTYKAVEPFSEGMALVKEGATKPRTVERNETLLRHSVPALVNDPDLIRKDIEVCTQVIKLDPTNAQAFRDRGYLLCALTRFNESLADFQQVIALCSSSSEGYYWRGMAHMQLGRYPEAVIDFTNAVEMEPQKPQNLMGKALALRGLKRPELALNDINRAILLTDHPYYHRIRGLIYEDLGQTTDAVRDLQIGRRAAILEPWPAGPRSLEEIIAQAESSRKKLQTARETPQAHERIALLASEQADALEDLRRLKNREEKVLEIEDLCVRTVELRREALKNVEAATKDGDQLILYKSDLANAIAQLAGFYVRNKEFDKAKPLYDETLELARAIESPLKEADFLVDIGKMQTEKKDFKEAETTLKNALAMTDGQIDTSSRVVRGQALNAYARLLNLQKRTLDADIAMNNASDLLNFGADLAFLPSPPPLPANASSAESYELALQCKSLGLIETSRSYMKEALERATASGLATAEKKDEATSSGTNQKETADTKEKAERFLSAYVPKRPVDLVVTKEFQKGRTSELTGDLISAEKFYKACTEAAPEFEWAYEALARVKRTQGDFAQATKFAKKAVAINPNYVDGWLELARIDKDQGDVAKAKESVSKALSIDPDSQLAEFEKRHL